MKWKFGGVSGTNVTILDSTYPCTKSVTLQVKWLFPQNELSLTLSSTGFKSIKSWRPWLAFWPISPRRYWLMWWEPWRSLRKSLQTRSPSANAAASSHWSTYSSEETRHVRPRVSEAFFEIADCVCKVDELIACSCPSLPATVGECDQGGGGLCHRSGQHGVSLPHWILLTEYRSYSI